MNRRTFIRSVAASLSAAALPLPFPPAGLLAGATASASPIVPVATYKWAEVIVRAHEYCNLGMLQRNLHIDATVAQALKRQLMQNGVITAHADAYGLHKAVRPLFEHTVPKPANAPKSTTSDQLKKQTASDNAYPADMICEGPESAGLPLLIAA